MMHTDMNQMLSKINTFDEFEKFKQKLHALEIVANEIVQKHNLPQAPLTLFSEGTNIVFEHGEKGEIIKIYPPMHTDQFKSEFLVLKCLAGKLSIPTPTINFYGEIFGWPYIVMSKVEGVLLETLWKNMGKENKLIIIRELGSLIREVHALSTKGLEEIDCHWNLFIEQQIEHCAERHLSNGLKKSLVEEIPAYIELIKTNLQLNANPVILTGEYTPMNILVKQVDNIWHISGLIDFGDCMLGMPEYDLLGPGAFLIQGDKILLSSFMIAYGYHENQLTNELSHKFAALMLLHKYSRLNVQLRINDFESKVKNLHELEQLVWGFDKK